LDVNGGVAIRPTGGSEGGQIDFYNPDATNAGMILDVSTADVGRIFQTRNNSLLQIGQLVGTGGIVGVYTAGSERVRIQADGTINAQGNAINNISGIQGITNASNPTAGYVGEFLTATNSTVVSIAVQNQFYNLTSLVLTPGDWDVWGGITFIPTTTTNFTQLIGAIHTVSANWNTNVPIGNFRLVQPATVPGNVGFTSIIQISPVRYNVSANTTIFLNAQASFSASNFTAQGTINARRMR
jgi:hypothetical protein